MLSYATTSLAVAIVAIVCILPVLLFEGKAAVRGSLADMVADALVFLFLGATLATQILLLVGLHEAELATWRMVGLYFVAINVALSAMPIGFDYARDLLRKRLTLPDVPDRLMTATLLVFGVCWLGEVMLLLTR